MKFPHATTIYSHELFEGGAAWCCEQHKGLRADHIMMAHAFTVDSTDHAQMPTQRFAVMVLVDGDAAQRTPKMAPEIIGAMYDSFHAMMCESIGLDRVNEALLRRMLATIGALDDDEDDEDVIERDGPPPVIH